MKKILILVIISCLFGMSSFAQNADEDIRAVLKEQTISWNEGNIEDFMKSYWNNDSLMFVGKNGVKWGWKETLKNYKKGYPDKTAMGKLSFDIIQVKKLSEEYYFVVGKWMLKRTIGNLQGHFNLLMKQIEGKWLIVADHSS